MIKLFNENNNEINILHFQGTAKLFYSNIMKQIETIGNLDKDITIVTTFNNYEYAILAQQLDNLNIKYINKVPLGSDWINTLKPKYIVEALKEVNTKYCLILDANDILLSGNLSNILNIFRETKLKMLFNASKNNYPSITIDKIRDRDWRGEFKYFNAGACIAETEFALKFYKICEKEIKDNTIVNPLNSEQLIIRTVFADNVSDIDFDYKREIFTTFGNTQLEKIDYEKYRVL